MDNDNVAPQVKYRHEFVCAGCKALVFAFVQYPPFDLCATCRWCLENGVPRDRVP